MRAVMILLTYRHAILKAFTGSMTFLQVFGQSILIIDSANVAFDLLEKRSRIYSSRPESTMVKM